MVGRVCPQRTARYTPRRNPNHTDHPGLRLPRPVRHERGEGWGEEARGIYAASAWNGVAGVNAAGRSDGEAA